MRCVVLGGTGFIGSHVVEGLVAAGHEVRSFGLDPVPSWALTIPADFVTGSWSDLEKLRTVVAGADVVVHLIWSTLPAPSNLDMAGDAMENVVGSIRLLELCRGEGVKKVVFGSSGGTVYGQVNALPISEDTPNVPLTSYGVGKLTVERYLDVFHNLFGLHTIAIRPSNPYGERQNLDRPQGAVGVFMKALVQGSPIEIWGDGRVVRDYFYVGDLADAYRRAVESPITRGVFNVGSGVGLSLLRLVDVLREVTGATPEVVLRPARAIDVPANVLDVRRAARELGWTPKVSLAEGLERTWRWIKSCCAQPRPLPAADDSA
jgi:UDP-glucose 4-epimerase